jgi:hypothetical protein
MRKTIKKLAQLIDFMPNGNKKNEVKKDYLDLKLTKDDKFILLMEDKYKNL